ncbi:MAG TPA: ClpX C4-type zinc finger protein, partial [Pirellulales bacterium]|nr:ClpX C4-type zinc finger protein [Pirellulales bacterium]
MDENPNQPAGPDPTKQGFFAKLFPWLKGHEPAKRNAFCSFCRKSYKDVGPLVEGPGEVFICRECVQHCQSIL